MRPGKRLRKDTNLLIAIYYHPEAFPPTLNAIEQLSGLFSRITVLHRPHLSSEWKYPENVKLLPSGKVMPAKEQERSPLLMKAIFFLQFTCLFFYHALLRRPSFILVYDPVSLYSYSLVKSLFFFRHKLWYHNHDVVEMNQLKKYSIGWFAAIAEKKMINTVDLFTLPSLDRKKYFPFDISWKGKFIHLPNFPSVNIYDRIVEKKVHDTRSIKILFQGKISESRGIEEVISVLGKEIAGRKIELLLAGYCSDEYMNSLRRLTERLGVTGLFHYVGELPYARLPEIAKSCTIGLSIYSGNDIMNTTFITASNKLYEYAASGLPVLYLNREYYCSALRKYKWAFPVDLNVESLYDAIEKIINNYDHLSSEAIRDFRTELNYEIVFLPVRQYLHNSIYGS